MTDTTWAAKVLEGVPVAYFNTRQADTPSGNLLPEQWMPAADVIAAIAKLGAGDGLLTRAKRLTEPDGNGFGKPPIAWLQGFRDARRETTPVIHGLVARIAALTAQVAEAEREAESRSAMFATACEERDAAEAEAAALRAKGGGNDLA